MLIAQLECRSGQTRDTIRYYERLGLITRPLRGDNGYRLYDERAVVELRYGLSDGRSRTRRLVGEELAISTDRARDIETMALERLRRRHLVSRALSLSARKTGGVKE